MATLITLLTDFGVADSYVGEGDEGGHQGVVRSPLSVIRHTVARRQAPMSQNRVIAIPRRMAVTDSASQMPSTPMALDHQAASGTRSNVSDVLVSCGHRL